MFAVVSSVLPSEPRPRSVANAQEAQHTSWTDAVMGEEKLKVILLHYTYVSNSSNAMKHLTKIMISPVQYKLHRVRQ